MPSTFERNRFAVGQWVEAQQREFEAILPCRLAVATPAIAAELREQGTDFRREGDRRGRRRLGGRRKASEQSEQSAPGAE